MKNKITYATVFSFNFMRFLIYCDLFLLGHSGVFLWGCFLCVLWAESWIGTEATLLPVVCSFHFLCFFFAKRTRRVTVHKTKMKRQKKIYIFTVAFRKTSKYFSYELIWIFLEIGAGDEQQTLTGGKSLALNFLRVFESFEELEAWFPSSSFFGRWECCRKCEKFLERDELNSSGEYYF